MTVARRIFFNTIYQSAGKILSTAIALVSVGLTTRYLGQTGYGEYTTVISFMGFFGILADLGLYLTATKKISDPGADKKKIRGGIFGLRLVTVIAALTVTSRR